MTDDLDDDDSVVFADAHRNAGDQLRPEQQLNAWTHHIPALPAPWDQAFPKPFQDVTGGDGLLPWLIPPEVADQERHALYW
jgi:hypothetical protein